MGTKLARRRANQTRKERPIAQYYGGSQEESRDINRRNERGISSAEAGINDGVDRLDAERANAQNEADVLWKNAEDERWQYDGRTTQLRAESAERAAKHGQQSDQYGAGADGAMADYAGGRTAALGNAASLEKNNWMQNYGSGRSEILGGAGRLEAAGGKSADMLEAAGSGSASELEGYARGAAAEYQSGADARFNASAARTQRDALALAAGRGNSSVRTALASATAANRQANLDQQVTRAQEANQLNSMRNDAVANAAGIRTGAMSGAAAIRGDGILGAAGIRSGLSAQDQQAAQIQADQVARAAAIRQQQGAQDQQATQIQAQRQQAATGFVLGEAGMQAQSVDANAAYQQQMLAQQQAVGNANTTFGMQTGGAVVNANTAQRDAYLGAETAKNTAELGGALQTEAQRQEHAKNNSAAAKFQRGVGIATLGIGGSK